MSSRSLVWVSSPRGRIAGEFVHIETNHIWLQNTTKKSNTRTMRRSPFENQTCSAAQALSEIGEWWTLLILREAFFGTQRFTDFQERLGIARNILTARLNKLVEKGILTRQSAPGRGNPRLYRLTAKGRDTLPVFIALTQWGDRWINGGGKAPIRILEAATGQEIDTLRACARDGRPLAARDMRIVPGPGADPGIRRRFGGAGLAAEAADVASSFLKAPSVLKG
jgi:DNA-binding HxlR family transcriptional regulator